MNWRLVAGLCGLAVAAGAVYYAVSRTSPSRLDEARAEHYRAQAELQDRARAEFEKVRVRPIAELSSIAEASRAVAPLEKALKSRAPGGTSPPEEIARYIAEFFHYRYVNTSASEYAAWRAARGYERVPLKELLDERLPPRAVKHWTGSPVPEGTTVEQLFDAVFAASLRRPGAHALAIAADDRGYGVIFGELTARRPHLRERPEGLIRGELWISQAGQSLANWWKFGPPPGELIKLHGRAVYCEVAVLVEFEEGLRYPMVFTFFWDPGRNVWKHEYLNLYHAKAEGFAF